jgi:hypothetical protein
VVKQDGGAVAGPKGGVVHADGGRGAYEWVAWCERMGGEVKPDAERWRARMGGAVLPDEASSAHP